jgi:hypothetical protein
MNKYVIISAVVSALVTWIFMYLDAKLFDTPKSKFTYFKGIVFVTSLVAGIVHILTLGSQMVQLPLANMAQASQIPHVQTAGGMDEIMHGMPPF